MLSTRAGPPCGAARSPLGFGVGALDARMATPQDRSITFDSGKNMMLAKGDRAAGGGGIVGVEGPGQGLLDHL